MAKEAKIILNNGQTFFLL